MRAPTRTWAWIAAITVSALVVAARAPLGLDYESGLQEVGDAAAPQIDDLIRFDLSAFARRQAAQGPVSLVLRAPAAALAPERDQLSRYRMGVFCCVLILGLAAYWLLCRLDRPWWQKATTLTVIIASPVSLAVVRWGHPEDLLATGLLIAGLVAGSGGLALVAGVLAGLAIATKAWALLGVPAIVIAARGRELRAAALAVAVAALLTAPLAIANPTAFRHAVNAANAAPLVHPADIWWTLSRREITVNDGVALRRIRAPSVPAQIRHLVRPMLVLLAAVVFALLARRRAETVDLLLALALVFLLRCVLDPGDNAYYHAPFLIFLAAWELTAFRRLPVLALVATAVTATAPGPIGPHRDLANLSYLLWTLPAIVVLAFATLGRNRPVVVLADKHS